MNSFVANDEEIRNFLYRPNMKKQDGIMFAYVTSAEKLAELVPKPLKVVAPVIMGYVTHMGDPTFAAPYDEAVLYAFVSYQDKIMGAYPFVLYLSGEGAEEAMIAGREGACMPKKLADDIKIEKSENKVQAKIIRHGTEILNLKWEAGVPNDVETVKKMFGNQVKLGEPSEMASFFINYDIEQQDDGSNKFVNTELIATQSTGLTTDMEIGKIDMKLTSSEDDPLAELEVLKPVGGAHYKMDYSVMHKTLKLDSLNPEEIAPYLIAGHYDRTFVTKQD